MRLSRRGLFIVIPALAAPATLQAQGTYPNRPVRLVVPFSGGGATDVTARVIAERLTQSLGQPVIVDNRAGAGGNLGAEMVAKADPDGHTLLMSTIGTASINPHLYSRLPFDPVKDFASIALVNGVANGIICHPGVPANSLPELIALAKRKPGELSYGTPGNGTSGHMCGELLKVRAGIDIMHVPYRGTANAITDMLGGRIDMCIDNLPAYLPHIREGRARLLAVTSRNRWFAAPDAPTVAEAGVPDFEAIAWFGMQAPARTPRAIVDKLADGVLAALREEAVIARLREIGSEPMPMGPAQFDSFIAAENRKWADVVRISGAKLD